MSSPSSATPAAPAQPAWRARLRWLTEVGAFIGLWAAADLAVRTWSWSVPSGVVGLMALTAVLTLGWLPARHIERGARWLLGDMLLFFIPPLMALIRHQELFGWMGVKLAIAVAVGTLFVMGGVGWVVERAIRWEDAR